MPKVVEMYKKIAKNSSPGGKGKGTKAAKMYSEPKQSGKGKKK